MSGKRVWITGAASGIGRALTREFLSRGARVLALDLEPSALNDLAAEANLLGFSVDTAVADVSLRERYLAQLEEACAHHGAPDIMINNAGVARVAAFGQDDLAAFAKVLSVNLDGVIYGTHFALSRMAASGGTIVNMASIAGHLPTAAMTSYSASKFAVVGFSRALQAELAMAHSPVKVCLVSPGFVKTPIMDQPGHPFPRMLAWMVATPTQVARRIADGVAKGQPEIYPDAGGRLMKALYAVAPGWTVKSSRVLLAKSLRQVLGLEPIHP